VTADFDVYISFLLSNEIFSPSNKIYREIGQAKDLSAPQVAAVSPCVKKSALHRSQLSIIFGHSSAKTFE